MLLGPAQVHAQQHLGPVLALGAAGAGGHLQEGVVVVGLAGQHRFQLQPVDLLLHPLQVALDLVEGGLVALLLGQLGEPDRVGQSLLQPALAVDRRPPAGCARP